MFPIKEFERRFEALLDELDALAEACGGEAGESLEELNAELEDALMLLGEIRPDGEDWREELDGALEELGALAEDYRRLSPRADGLEALAGRVAMAVEFAAKTLGETDSE